MKLGTTYSVEELSAIVLSFEAEIADLSLRVDLRVNDTVSMRRDDLRARVYEINNRIIEALDL